MNKFLLVLAVSIALTSLSCGPKRWSEGDPRKTPQPTDVEVIESVEIGIGVSAESGGNTLSAQ